MKVYGLIDCINTLKAREWFNENLITFEFHDIRQNGISLEKIVEWDKKAGYLNFLNKHARTWSTLYPRERELANTRELGILLMYKKLRIIKRPIIEIGESVYFGFDEGQYRSAFLSQIELADEQQSRHEICDTDRGFQRKAG